MPSIHPPVDEPALVEHQGSSHAPIAGRIPILALTVVCGLFAVEAWKLGVGELRSPGPGLWPFVTAIATLGAAVWTIFTSAQWMRAPDIQERWPGILAVAFAAYAALLGIVGFMAATFLLSLLVTIYVGRTSWRTGLVVSAVVPVLVYGVFSIFLNSPLPTGMFL